RDQRRPAHLLLDQVEHRIGRVGGCLVGEVHAGVEADIDATRHDPEIDVRRHGSVPATPRHLTGLDGLEGVEAGLEVRAGASPSAQMVVHPLGVVRVSRMPVTPFGFGLPDLDQHAPYWRAGAVDHSALNGNALAARLGTCKHVPEIVLEDLKAGLLWGETDV